MKFNIVDAFSGQLFGGNQAGVVILEKGQEYPEDEIMRKVAAELRYSETAFVKPIDEGFKLRYFTPAAEVELCGHATVGSFAAMLDRGMVKDGQAILVKTLSGDIEVVVMGDSVLMDMAQPQDFGKLDSEREEECYKILGINKPDLGEVYAEKISTGLVDIILPVESEEVLNAISPDFKALARLSDEENVVGVHAVCLDGRDGKIHARNFAPLYDIDEEAATGTSNGALAYYLYKRGMVELDREYTVVQGEAMGRPSLINFVVTEKGGEPKIKVGGKAAILASGEMNI